MVIRRVTCQVTKLMDGKLCSFQSFAGPTESNPPFSFIFKPACLLPVVESLHLSAHNLFLSVAFLCAPSFHCEYLICVPHRLLYFCGMNFIYFLPFDCNNIQYNQSFHAAMSAGRDRKKVRLILEPLNIISC